ncbi:hypothetical protein CAOG_04169 [Capsaspora owczarzaki ATCC 30864]|uniref:EF-hand domain-containing protein n=1 Tax=Capsaspora owczarzaki (strain ATCC 30864) TaxID=595528 RepID=A0A0D2WPK7_CAPO3|nr:hypothetical protein CAOG_04169 [Capsaspora owczarzaki ATCC 30864]KJE93370.1 hypothetical protein CAOG_004169 [Capsaspora owczarzaki ATCC 30864]|eukprot:XP_004347994.1 hypothetical protein CAOG_04169 [Capsaspora owczarzaki ATCC 30864]
MYTSGARKPLVRIMFDKFDTDKSGFLDSAELKSLCYDLGHPLSPVELDLALKMLDENGDGKISYNEFAQWWQQQDRFNKLTYDEEEIRSVTAAVKYFQHFDKDKSGTIDANEFKALYKDLLKNGFRIGTVEQALSTLDSNGDGHVSLREYVDWLVAVGSIVLKEKPAE